MCKKRCVWRVRASIHRVTEVQKHGRRAAAFERLSRTDQGGEAAGHGQVRFVSARETDGDEGRGYPAARSAQGARALVFDERHCRPVGSARMMRLS